MQVAGRNTCWNSPLASYSSVAVGGMILKWIIYRKFHFKPANKLDFAVQAGRLKVEHSVCTCISAVFNLSDFGSR